MKISANPKTEIIGKNILYTENTDSTNLWAKENNFLPDGTVFVAETQNCGRGRRGNKWVSDKDGLWFSILLKPDISPEHVSVITLVAGMAVCDAIGNGAGIKWPNDIIMSSKKVCGILTEMSCGEVNSVICGIGINLNTAVFDDSIKNVATSIMAETGIRYDKTEFLFLVLEKFEKFYNKFLTDGFECLRDEYKNNCVTLNRIVSIKDSLNCCCGTAVDVDVNGELVCIIDGERKNIKSGDVSVRGLLGYAD